MRELADLPPEAVAEEVSSRVSTSSNEVLFLWVTVQGGREEYQSEIAELLSDTPVVPWIVRDAQAFSDANTLSQDIAEVIDRSEAAVNKERFRALCEKNGVVAYVLLSKVSLGVAQTGSPVRLPNWFPVARAQERYVIIDDITWSTHVSLESEALEIEAIREALYWVDRHLAERLQRVAASKPNEVAPFRDKFLKGEEVGGVKAWSRSVEIRLIEIPNPRAYRPTLKNSCSVVSRIWRIVACQHLDGLGKYGKALSRAVDPLSDASTEESIAFLIGRPSSPLEDAEARWGVNLLLSCFAACQLSNAAAHSDNYQQYPVTLLKAFSVDVTRALDSIAQVLR